MIIRQLRVAGVGLGDGGGGFKKLFFKFLLPSTSCLNNCTKKFTSGSSDEEGNKNGWAGPVISVGGAAPTSPKEHHMAICLET